jgi:hypothetical protein
MRTLCFDLAAAAAPWATLLPQPAVHGHVTRAFARGAFGIRRMQCVNAGGLQLQLRHVGVDHHELLLVEQYAIG